MILREHLLPQLCLPEDEHAYVCKREANAYLSVNTSHFTFLDCLLYLSPGTSLDDFLLAYASGDPQERKFWFPYESMKSLEDLQRTDMPRYEDYFSHLKGHNTLETERRRYQGLLDSGLSKKDALLKMGLKDEPPTGHQNYQTMVKVWEDHDMKNLEQLLTWYNKQDVQPMVSALTRLRDFYRAHDINLFKQCCTVAGASRIMLFRTAREEQACFSLPRKDETYLQEKILEEGITGQWT